MVNKFLSKLVNLDRIKYIEGPSSFFATIANYKEEEICVITPDDFEYYDFGTVPRFIESTFQLIDTFNNNEVQSKFLDSCIEKKLVEPNKFKEKGYFSNQEKVANFSGAEILEFIPKNTVILKSSKKYEKSGIYFNDYFSAY